MAVRKYWPLHCVNALCVECTRISMESQEEKGNGRIRISGY